MTKGLAGRPTPCGPMSSWRCRGRCRKPVGPSAFCRGGIPYRIFAYGVGRSLRVHHCQTARLPGLGSVQASDLCVNQLSSCGRLSRGSVCRRARNVGRDLVRPVVVVEIEPARLQASDGPSATPDVPKMYRAERAASTADLVRSMLDGIRCVYTLSVKPGSE
jgi:hypothetical protein